MAGEQQGSNPSQAGGQNQNDQPAGAGGAATAQQTGTQPNRISEGDYGKLQSRYQNAPTPIESTACLCVMLNKRHGFTPRTLNETLGVKNAWSEGVLNAWDNGGMGMLQSFAGSNGSPWGS